MLGATFSKGNSHKVRSHQRGTLEEYLHAQNEVINIYGRWV